MINSIDPETTNDDSSLKLQMDTIIVSQEYNISLQYTGTHTVMYYVYRYNRPIIARILDLRLRAYGTVPGAVQYRMGATAGRLGPLAARPFPEREGAQ